MSKIWLNLGSGVHLRAGFVNVDNSFSLEDLKSGEMAFKQAKIEKGAKFVRADIKHMPFPDNYADYVEMMHVVEHFPMWHVIDYMKEVYRVMKPGARVVIETPSFTGLAIDWLQMVTSKSFDLKDYYSVAETIYGNQYADCDGETHRCPITADFMKYILVKAGFTKGEVVIIPKGVRMPKVGTVDLGGKFVARNDLLVVEAYK